jgi:hypothetical protein
MIIKTVNDFVAALNKAFEGTAYSFEFTAGAKYFRVIAVSHGSRSAYCFVDKEGNIYKTASWAAPAKGVRMTFEKITQAHIDDIAKMGYASTMWLYR